MEQVLKALFLATMALGYVNAMASDPGADIQVQEPVIPENCRELDFHNFEVPPVLKTIFTPISKPEVLQQQISGRVVLRAFVLANRGLCDLETLFSDDDVLLEVCRDVIKSSRFSPARMDEKSVDGYVDLVFWIERTVYDRVIHKHEEPGFEEHAPYASDLATVEVVLLHTGEEKRVWVYDGVAFIGDVSLSRYWEARGIAELDFDEEERISEVWVTRLAYGDHRFEERHRLEYMVVTRRQREDGTWAPGRKHQFTYDGCTYGLVPATEWGSEP